MLIDVAIVVSAFFLSIPGVAGYFAHSYGRSFWLWFILGTFFPIVAHIVLAILCMKDKTPVASDKHLYMHLTRYEEEYMQQHIHHALHQPDRGNYLNPGRASED